MGFWRLSALAMVIQCTQKSDSCNFPEQQRRPYCQSNPQRPFPKRPLFSGQVHLLCPQRMCCLVHSESQQKAPFFWNDGSAQIILSIVSMEMSIIIILRDRFPIYLSLAWSRIPSSSSSSTSLTTPTPPHPAPMPMEKTYAQQLLPFCSPLGWGIYILNNNNKNSHSFFCAFISIDSSYILSPVHCHILPFLYRCRSLSSSSTTTTVASAWGS